MGSIVGKRYEPLNGEDMAPPIDDHDLLIRIDTKLEMLHDEIRSFETNSNADRARLWSEKAGVTELASLASRLDRAASSAAAEDHERRLRIIERYVWLSIGGLFILQVGMTIIMRFGLPH